MARARTGGGFESVIGRATRVRGRVSGEGELRIEGSVEGDIAVRGDVVLAEGARAASNVEAHAVTLAGELQGDVRATGAIHVGATARVRGDLQGDSVAIDEGAEYSGTLTAEFELPVELAAPRRR